MLGNLRGWIFSIIIFAATVGLFIWKGRPEPRSSSTGTLKVAMAPVPAITPPENIVPRGTKDQDAADIYRELAANVKTNNRAYDDFIELTGPKKRAAIKTLERDMDLLIAGGECARMNLFNKNPAEVVNYDNRKPVLPELQKVATTAITVGGLWATPDSAKNDKKPVNLPKARKVFTAIFQLGRFLAEERITFEEYRIGMELMNQGAGMLAKFGDLPNDQKDVLGAFQPSTDLSHYLTTYATVSGVPAENKMMGLPGDIFDVALNSKEPMWQTEAILKLGRMRYMRGVKSPDQRDAKVVLAELAARSDLPPSVKAAAIAARDLTVEKFRMIGGSA